MYLDGSAFDLFAPTWTLKKWGVRKWVNVLILASVEYIPMSGGSGILLLMRTDVEDKYHYQADQAGKQDIATNCGE